MILEISASGFSENTSGGGERYFSELSNFLSARGLAVSPSIEKEIPAKHKEKVHLIFPQVNLQVDKLNFVESKDNETYSIPKKYALVASYLNDRKRVDLIIRSWKFVENEISLIVVGDGPEYDKLITLSKDLGLTGKVIFTGRVSDFKILNLIKNSTFCVLASEREGFPTFIIESLKMGVPAIFFISNGENIYKEFDSDYLHISKLLDPWQMSIEINQFINKVRDVNHEFVKQWGSMVFSIKEDMKYIFSLNKTRKS